MNELFNNIEQNVNKYIESTNSKNDDIIMVAHGIIYELKEEIKQLETTNSKNDEIIMVAHGIIYDLKEENNNLFVSNNNGVNKLRIYKYKVYLLCCTKKTNIFYLQIGSGCGMFATSKIGRNFLRLA